MEVSLGRELTVAEHYLDIERIRFGGKVALDVDLEPGTASVPVPSFLLQPLVENAVRHGLAPRASGGRIRIHAALDTEHLALTVEDDGLGAASPGRRDKGLGLGLSNLRERLGQRYGAGASMIAGPLAQGGFGVSLRIPLQPGPPPCPAEAGA
jgi:LytS/YehU family sensor histidine kinase